MKVRPARLRVFSCPFFSEELPESSHPTIAWMGWDLPVVPGLVHENTLAQLSLLGPHLGICAAAACMSRGSPGNKTGRALSAWVSNMVLTGVPSPAALKALLAPPPSFLKFLKSGGWGSRQTGKLCTQTGAGRHLWG